MLFPENIDTLKFGVEAVVSIRKLLNPSLTAGVAQVKSA